MTRIAAIRARWSEWVADPWHYDDRVQYVRSQRGVLIGEICGTHPTCLGDVVAEAPADIAWLLGEIERLSAPTLCSTCSRALRRYTAGCDHCHEPGAY
jgi:hypothetical protein